MPFTIRGGVVVFLLLSGAGAIAEDTSARRGHGSTGDRKVVLLELFSSQGCSSCPPAEELLAELPRKGFPADKVVAAAFHVDYWDRLGWKDPFASERWTKRQKETARALGQDGLYTPELVWDGRGHGASTREACAELGRLLDAKPRASLALDGELVTSKLKVKGKATPLGGRLDAGLALELLVLEDDLVTKVEKGENGGRTLRETAVVRDVAVAWTLEKASSDPVSFETTFDVRGSWKPESLHVVAILREAKTFHAWQALDVALVASSS